MTSNPTQQFRHVFVRLQGDPVLDRSEHEFGQLVWGEIRKSTTNGWILSFFLGGSGLFLSVNRKIRVRVYTHECGCVDVFFELFQL